MNVVTCFYCRQEVFETTEQERKAAADRLVETFGLQSLTSAGLDEGWRRDVDYAKMLCSMLHKGGE